VRDKIGWDKSISCEKLWKNATQKNFPKRSRRDAYVYIQRLLRT